MCEQRGVHTHVWLPCLCLLCTHTSNLSSLDSEMCPSYAQAPTIAPQCLDGALQNTCLSLTSLPHAHLPSLLQECESQQEG